MDIAKTTEPRSDQINYDDFISSPKTVTVQEVKKGSAEQPVEVHLTEFPGRPFKPSKSMRRVLVAAWGPEASVYKGRKMTLYGDPEVRFGKEKVGGIRISHLSDIAGTMSISLTVTRGRRAPFIVQPLGAPARDWLKEASQLTTPDEIAALGVEARASHAPEPIMKALTEAFKAAGGVVK